MGGAKGYFQVMPSTFKALKVKTNIEAGIKYLSQMIRRFDREDYALGAYNGGPGRIARGRPRSKPCNTSCSSASIATS